MKQLRQRMPTIDQCCFYLAQGAHLYPSVHDHYLEEIAHLERMGKASLIPTTILERFHRRIRHLLAA